MNLKSKKLPLMILGITSILCSRMTFLFFNDPEGPNLLVVLGLAAILYFPSVAIYAFKSSASNRKRLLLAISAQMLIAVILYLTLS